MPNRKCSYQEKYSQEWSFINRGRNDHEVECIMCKCYIGIAHGGKSDIHDHIGSGKHKTKMHAANTSKRLDNYFVLKSSEQEKLVQAAELTICYHTVKHHMSFSSLDCTTKLSSKTQNDFLMTQKQQKMCHCGELKQQQW